MGGIGSGGKREGAGRKPGLKDTVHTRHRKRAAKLLFYIYKCGIGEMEMSATQLNAAVKFVNKFYPDLKAVEHSGTIEHRNAIEMTDEQLAAIIAGSSLGVTAPPDSAEESPELH